MRSLRNGLFDLVGAAQLRMSPSCEHNEVIVLLVIKQPDCQSRGSRWQTSQQGHLGQPCYSATAADWNLKDIAIGEGMD